jgi:lipopolysaccharide export system ATP-binding protein
MNRLRAADTDNPAAEAADGQVPVGSVHLNGDSSGSAADATLRAGDGHAMIQIDGMAVDPRTVEGLVGYHIGKAYKGRPVVRDVSVGVQRGEVVGLLGPNGAGKTTCFYVITGLIRADSGAVYLDGEEVTDLPMYQRARGGISYLPQEASIFRGMTVEDNIMAVLEVAEADRAKRRQIVDQLLSEFSIEHLRRVQAMALSGGERRRVEIARCLATRPNYILLDEPLAGIDPIAVGDIRDIVTHLKDRGIGVLITDHNVRDTLEIVDRAYVMHEGKVLSEGTPRELVRDPQVRRVYLGERFSL